MTYPASSSLPATFNANESYSNRLLRFGARQRVILLKEVEAELQAYDAKGGGASKIAFKEKIIKVNIVFQIIIGILLGACAFAPIWVSWGIGLPFGIVIACGGAILASCFQNQIASLKREHEIALHFKGMLQQHSFSCRLKEEWSLPTAESLYSHQKKGWDLPTFSSLHPAGEYDLPEVDPRLKSDHVMKKEMKTKHPKTASDLERLVTTLDLDITPQVQKHVARSLAQDPDDGNWKKVQQMVAAAKEALREGNRQEYVALMAEAKRAGLYIGDAPLEIALPLPEPENRLKQVEREYHSFITLPLDMTDEVYEIYWQSLQLASPKKLDRDAEKKLYTVKQRLFADCLIPGQQFEAVWEAFLAVENSPIKRKELFARYFVEGHSFEERWKVFIQLQTFPQKKEALLANLLVERPGFEEKWEAFVEDYKNLKLEMASYFPIPPGLSQKQVIKILSAFDRQDFSIRMAELFNKAHDLKTELKKILLEHPFTKMSSPWSRDLKGYDGQPFESCRVKLKIIRSRMLKESTVEALVRWCKADPERVDLSAQAALQLLPTDRKRQELEAWVEKNADMQQESLSDFLAFLPPKEIYEGLRAWIGEHPKRGDRTLNSILKRLPLSPFKMSLQKWIHDYPHLGDASIKSILAYLPSHALRMELKAWMDAYPKMKEASLNSVIALLSYKAIGHELQSVIHAHPGFARMPLKAALNKIPSPDLQNKLAHWIAIYPEIKNDSLQAVCEWISSRGMREGLETWIDDHLELQDLSLYHDVIGRHRQLEEMADRAEQKLKALEDGISEQLEGKVDKIIWQDIKTKLYEFETKTLTPLGRAVDNRWVSSVFKRAYRIFMMKAPVKPFDKITFSEKDTPYLRHLKMERMHYEELLKRIDTEIVWIYKSSILGAFAFQVVEVVALLIMQLVLLWNPWAIWGVGAAIALAQLSIHYLLHRLDVKQQNKQALMLPEILHNYPDIRHVPGNRPKLLELQKLQARLGLEGVVPTWSAALEKGDQVFTLDRSKFGETYLRSKLSELDNFIKSNPEIERQEQREYGHLKKALSQVEEQENAADADLRLFRKNLFKEYRNLRRKLEKYVDAHPGVKEDDRGYKHLMKKLEWAERVAEAAAAGPVQLTEVFCKRKADLSLRLDRLYLGRRDNLQRVLAPKPISESLDVPSIVVSKVKSLRREAEQNLEKYESNIVEMTQDIKHYERVMRRFKSLKEETSKAIDKERLHAEVDRFYTVRMLVKEVLDERKDDDREDSSIDVDKLLRQMLNLQKKIQKDEKVSEVQEERLKKQMDRLRTLPKSVLSRIFDDLSLEIYKIKARLQKREQAEALLDHLTERFESPKAMKRRLKANKEEVSNLKEFLIRWQRDFVGALKYFEDALKKKPQLEDRLFLKASPCVEVQDAIIGIMAARTNEDKIDDRINIKHVLNSILKIKEKILRQGLTQELFSELQKYFSQLEKASNEDLDWAFEESNQQMVDRIWAEMKK